MKSTFNLLNNTTALTQLSFSSVFINLLSLALPFTMLQIYDRILPNQSYGTATVLVIGVAIAILLELFLRYARSWMLASSAANFELQTTINVVNRIMEADHQPLDKMGSGSLFNSLSGIATMRDLYSGQAAVAIMDFPFVLIFLGLVAYIGGPLVFIPIVVWFVVISLVLLISKNLSKVTDELSVTDSQRSSILLHVLSGLTTVKALALEQRLSREYRELNFKRLAEQEKIDWLSAKLQELIQGASQATTLILVLLGCLSVLNGDLTTGGLAACSILAGRAVAPLSAIVSLRSRIAIAKVAMANVDGLLSLPKEAFTSAKIYNEKLPLGPIQFKAVNFEHMGAKLTQLSLTIQAGQLCTIQSNPLTHASAVLQTLGLFKHVNAGSISIDGVEIVEHAVNEFRQSVLYVPPWPTLFAGSLLENMTMFQPQYESLAMQYANVLGLTNTIAQLPAGYSTQVTEDNNKMIGKGAIKLMAIIRAMVQSPSILLLDEPMIALDSDSQARLLTLLRSLKGEMTMLAVSYFDELSEISDVTMTLTNEGEENTVLSEKRGSTHE
ncbi:toxin ABC transporter [Colwellia sp. 75C3]|uniref:ABC transporter transmembrane domain-containing protein n=1 Tax=Colwellia sp. 75C3 TaxID=888425 RepID=UPI000C346B22|nr:ABC transporter transmembrane domain-containing protein [Colwellia sp. 75C3]PKG83303.1 toxin ABC transporter [Colwellia sp. 75C3]